MTTSRELSKLMIKNGLILILGCSAGLWAAGCNHPNQQESDQQLRDQAAQTTQQVKKDAKEAAADARVAAANAERKVDDIATGVKDGMHSNAKPAPGSIDINSASAGQLATLPGISAARARSIIDNRPYGAPHDLVNKGVVSEAEYARISGNIVAE